MPKPGFLQRSLACLLLLAGCAGPQKAVRHERWVPYYDVKVPVGQFSDYDLIVFDAKHYVDFTSLKPKTTVLAYISLGEINAYSDYVAELQGTNAIVKKNPNWPAFIMDVRHPRWRQIILEEQIPDLIAKGFDGIMIDTADSALALDNASDKRYYGMTAACVSLIREIHEKYPDLKIMLNRGFPLLHEVGDIIDYTLAESVMTTYDAHNNKHRVTKPSEHMPIYETLRLAQARNPRLKIYTLDYWNMNDVKGVQFIYQEQRKRGFIPHVTSPDLRTFYDEHRVLSPDTAK